MPRQKRLDVAGEIYHTLNRGNAREEIFYKEEDYVAFDRVLGACARGRAGAVRLFSYALMPNHVTSCCSPSEMARMGRLLRWVTATHSLRRLCIDRGRPYGDETWTEEIGVSL